MFFGIILYVLWHFFVFLMTLFLFSASSSTKDLGDKRLFNVRVILLTFTCLQTNICPNDMKDWHTPTKLAFAHQFLSSQIWTDIKPAFLNHKFESTKLYINETI